MFQTFVQDTHIHTGVRIDYVTHQPTCVYDPADEPTKTYTHRRAVEHTESLKLNTVKRSGYAHAKQMNILDTHTQTDGRAYSMRLHRQTNEHTGYAETDMNT